MAGKANGSTKKIVISAISIIITGLFISWVTWASGGITENKKDIATVKQKTCSTDEKVDMVREDTKERLASIDKKLDKLTDLLLAEKNKKVVIDKDN